MQRSSIELAMASGAPITCASCRHFHDGNMFCGKDCGGPGAGKDFPSYNGPIPRERFVERCLICGRGQPEFMIVGLDTKLSLCKKHKDVFNYVGSKEDGPLHAVIVIAAE